MKKTGVVLVFLCIIAAMAHAKGNAVYLSNKEAVVKVVSVLQSQNSELTQEEIQFAKGILQTGESLLTKEEQIEFKELALVYKQAGSLKKMPSRNKARYEKLFLVVIENTSDESLKKIVDIGNRFLNN